LHYEGNTLEGIQHMPPTADAALGLPIPLRVEGDGPIEIAGDLDMTGAERLRTELTHRSLFRRGTVIRLDMSAVDFIDSAALQVLWDAAEMLERRGGRLVVESPAPCVRRLLELTGIAARLGLNARVAA
jgi:anti-sigma B factor antagonist